MFFVASWFGLSFVTLFFAILFSFYLLNVKVVTLTQNDFKLYTAIPEDGIHEEAQITSKDGRHIIISNFFKKYASPLSSYGQNFVTIADKYQLDFRLLPAISMQESNGGKKIVRNSFNPFGYGIYDNLVVRFKGWEEGIEKVAKTLREDYLNQGLTTPKKIMTKYTPPALSKGGNWAKGVSVFMEELH